MSQAFPSKRKGKPALIKEVVDRVMKTATPAAIPFETQILAAWETIAGETVAVHSKPYRFNQGTLFIVVDHPTWKMEIQARSSDSILKNIQKQFGENIVKQLRFTVGNLV